MVKHAFQLDGVESLVMSVIYCPDFFNWYGKTDPKDEWYHSMGWRPRLTKREKAS